MSKQISNSSCWPMHPSAFRILAGTPSIPVAFPFFSSVLKFIVQYISSRAIFTYTYWFNLIIRWFTILIVQSSTYSFHSLYICPLSVKLLPSLSFMTIIGLGLLFFFFVNSFTFQCIRSILPCLSSFSISSHCSFCYILWAISTVWWNRLLIDLYFFLPTQSECTALHFHLLFMSSINSRVIHGLQGEVLRVRPIVSIAANVTVSLKSVHLPSKLSANLFRFISFSSTKWGVTVFVFNFSRFHLTVFLPVSIFQAWIQDLMVQDPDQEQDPQPRDQDQDQDSRIRENNE